MVGGPAARGGVVDCHSTLRCSLTPSHSWVVGAAADIDMAAHTDVGLSIHDYM